MGLRLPALLLLSALLPGCAVVTTPASDFASRNWPGWGGPRPGAPLDSLTAQRVRAGGMTAEPTAQLRPEPGDMWPVAEAPRATLANPDEALRGVGNQRMGFADPATEARRPARGSSSPPPDPLLLSPPDAPRNIVPPVVPMPEPPPRPLRADGVAIPTPSGPETVTTRSGNVSTTLSPQGPGVAIRDGATTTIIRPNRLPEQVPTPR